VPLGVHGRAAKHFGEKRGHVARMVSAHVCENRREQRVVLDVLVEPAWPNGSESMPPSHS